MTKLTPSIWIGNSSDAQHADLRKSGIGAILNVAHDLQGRRGWTDGVLYAQCGLVDGPGNPLAAYHAAILMLHTLAKSSRAVLVHCHRGESRSVAVIAMYLHALEPRGWEHWLSIIREKHETPDGQPHPAHRAAFDRINWRLLASVMEE